MYTSIPSGSRRHKRRVRKHKPQSGRRLLLEGLEPRLLLFGCDEHEQVTGAALPYLQPDVLADVNDEHLYQDVVGFFGNGHLDNSRFREGGEQINAWYRETLEYLDPLQFEPEEAADSFGKILHAAQDFYAHSNWTDLIREGQLAAGSLLEETLVFWDNLDPYSTHAGAMLVLTTPR